MIAIVNYQRGNLNNVLRAFQNYGFDTKIIDKPDQINQYKGVVLPGVGAFGDAIATLKKSGFAQAIKKYIASGKPFMGICVGFQLLFEEGHEFGLHEGLGIFKGKVVQFKTSLKVPHMGWNQIEFQKKSNILKEINNYEFFYFVHSFYVDTPEKDIILTTTEYDKKFVSSIEKDNVFACQFHPEKSQLKGLQIIKSFGEYCENYSGH